MLRRSSTLLPLLGAALLATSDAYSDDIRSLTLTWKDPGTYFPLEWGGNSIKTGPEHCHSYPEQWVEPCRLNAKIVDALDVRLDLKDSDWDSLKRQAQHATRKIQQCLGGKRPSQAPAGCYSEGDTNVVAREARDQFGGRWIVYSALGYPSEGRFEEPFWANAILQRLGPVHVRLDEKGRFLAVTAPGFRRLVDAQGIQRNLAESRQALER